MKSPVTYFGGKQRLAKYMVSLFPREHKVYVEVFGGGGALLFAKRAQTSKLEVYNDLDSGVFNFFSVLRDPKKAEKLCAALEITPHSRVEHTVCDDNWESCKDDVEKARMWYTAIMQGFATHLKSGWSSGVTRKATVPGKIHNRLKMFDSFVKRMRYVQVDNRDYKEVLAIYDDPDTFFYLDPPYVGDTRKASTGAYSTEMATVILHDELIQLLINLKGMAMLSGYAHDSYKILEERGWKRIDIATGTAICPGIPLLIR